MAVSRSAWRLALAMHWPDQRLVLFITCRHPGGNAVFLVSNALILLASITGYVLQRIKHHRLHRIS